MRTRDTGNRGKPASLGKPILGLLAFLWITAISITVITSDVYASSIQHQEPATIFAASCSTCHGSAGLGGVTFVKDGVGDNRTAPKIAGKPARYIKSKVRSGSKNAAMPAFGKEEITDAELNALANWLKDNPSGVLAPTTFTDGTSIAGTAVRLDILDADPWFWSGAWPAGTNRVDLTSSTQYLKVVNTGRTWHTFTNSKKLRDSGFIGYAGNYMDKPGDLGDIGYYYANQATSGTDVDSGLAYGCNKYWCKMHPYMAVEVCDSSTGAIPGPLTRASKMPTGNPSVKGADNSEIWVSVQSQEEANELHTADVGHYSPNSTGDPFGVGNDMDGVYQVIHAGDHDGAEWTTVDYIANVGNNPHNAWPGTDGNGKKVVLSANWHDNTVDVMMQSTKSLKREKRSGTTNAHMMVTPGTTDPDGPYDPLTGKGRLTGEDFYVTHMGGRAVQRLDVDRLELGFDPNIPDNAMSGDGLIMGATGPHGLWMCDSGRYILTADTFAGGATLYDRVDKTSVSTGSGGSSPLAPSIMSGYSGGCKRGFTNNALTTDVSIYDLSVIPSLGITRLPQIQADNAAPTPDYNQAGNIDLKDLTPDTPTCSEVAGDGVGNDDGTCEESEICGAPVLLGNGAICADPVRWAALPIQTPVSPDETAPGALTHGRFMVTANKASFNVSVTALDGSGIPSALYTFPAGLGAHGVTYGAKSMCDTTIPNDGIEDTAFSSGVTECYYAYVTNTFEGGRNGGSTAGYVSVYDLEKIDDGVSMGGPGSAFFIDTPWSADTDLSGGLPGAGDVLCIDLTGGDSALMDTNSEMAYVEGAAAGTVITDVLLNGPDLGTINVPPSGGSPCLPGEVELVVGANLIPDVVEIALLKGLVTTVANTGTDNFTIYPGSCVASGCIGDSVSIGDSLGSCLPPLGSPLGPPNGVDDGLEDALCNSVVLSTLYTGDTGNDLTDNVSPNSSCDTTYSGPANGIHDGVEALVCAGAVPADSDGDGTGPDLLAPITALCPDCRSGVHVGDVALKNATGLISDSTEYTYYRADVYVDDVNSFTTIITGGVPAWIGATAGIGGSINGVVPDVDLDLQINSGAQGIVGTPAATPWP